MANYHGYFSDLSCKQYEVKITASGDASDYQEILLADEQPFVVQYNVSDTPFDPVRTSTATINIVHDDYIVDKLSSCAQGTKVELMDITNNSSPTTLWVGYMTTNTMNAGYENCYETFSLEAADCLSSLQYKDYVEMNSGGVVSIKDVLKQIFEATGEIDRYYWTRSKKVNGEVLIPEHLAISEHNFQTNDTAEEWKLKDVLEEICRYLGFTCLQYGKYAYFVDYQYLEDHASLSCYYYPKSRSFGRYPNVTTLDGTVTIDADSYMGNGAQISFEPVYNKVTVNANMYAAEDIVPNIFDDKFLTNRINSGAFYTNVEISPESTVAEYPHGGTWYTLGFQQKYAKEKDTDKKDLYDNKYRYFMRIYDHKFYDSVYTQPNSINGVNPNTQALKTSACTKNYRGATIVDLGVVENPHRDEYQNWIVPSKLDYTRYLCICEKYSNPDAGQGTGPHNAIGYRKPVFKLKSGYRPMVMVDDKSYLVLYCSAIFERYDGRNYINPEWNNTECKTNWSAAGYHRNKVSQPLFKIHIGNYGWSTMLNKWVDLTGPEAGDDLVMPEMKWESNKIDFWNKNIEILNNVSWEDKLNCEGIKMPLSGIDITKGVEIQILTPDPSFYGNTGNPNFENKFYPYNAYCWIKDLSLKVVQEGQEDGGNESDIVYENVIDSCSVNDMGEIKVRITTHSYQVKPSYSDMIYSGSTGTPPVFLTGILEESLGNSTAQKPEENIIQKYVHQYSTQTKKISLTVDSEIKPFQRLKGVDVDNLNNKYVQLGTEIDYRMGRQTITAVEKTK